MKWQVRVSKQSQSNSFSEYIHLVPEFKMKEKILTDLYKVE